MIMTLFWLVIFIISFVKEPRRLINALIFGLLIVNLALSILIRSVPALLEESPTLLIVYIFIVAAAPPLLIFMLTIMTFFNSKILLEREGRRLSNLFFAMIGISIMLIVFASIIMLFTGQFIHTTTTFIYLWVLSLFIYGMFMYASFVSYAVIYHCRPIFYKPTYIITLGAGLIGDKVPPLLASRINKSVQQYYKYQKKTGSSPTLVMSGGQGKDELVPEAVAMRNYVVERYPDIPATSILIEDKSVDTDENMRFSKTLIEAHAAGKPYRSIFVTNEFHLFRASMYARRAGLDAQGVGSRTAFYYVPNAFTREFIGVLEMTKKYHITVFIMITTVYLFLIRAYS